MTDFAYYIGKIVSEQYFSSLLGAQDETNYTLSKSEAKLLQYKLQILSPGLFCNNLLRYALFL